MITIETKHQMIGSRQHWVSRATLLGALAVVSAGTEAACTFRNPLPGPIVFGALDPSIANTRTATSDFRVQCGGGDPVPTWTFSGANGNAPLRMKHLSVNAYIPYTAAAAYQSGGVGNQRWLVTATVLGTDYINALVGDYSDTLTATINP